MASGSESSLVKMETIDSFWTFRLPFSDKINKLTNQTSVAQSGSLCVCVCVKQHLYLQAWLGITVLAQKGAHQMDC